MLISIFVGLFADSLPESELLEMNDAEKEQRPNDGQRVKGGGGGIFAQGNNHNIILDPVF